MLSWFPKLYHRWWWWWIHYSTNTPTTNDCWNASGLYTNSSNNHQSAAKIVTTTAEGYLPVSFVQLLSYPNWCYPGSWNYTTEVDGGEFNSTNNMVVVVVATTTISIRNKNSNKSGTNPTIVLYHRRGMVRTTFITGRTTVETRKGVYSACCSEMIDPLTNLVGTSHANVRAD